MSAASGIIQCRQYGLVLILLLCAYDSTISATLVDSMTLGDLLIKMGRITQKQLEDALKNRVIYGGKIGTSLIEMGFIDDDELAQALSKQLDIPYVDPDVLLTIPEDVIAIVSLEMAQKYKVIPLSLDKRKLSLVMADASDLRAVDEIAFITGYNIDPVVAPEIRLMQALERYYKIEMDPRYLPIIKKLEETKKQAPSASEKKQGNQLKEGKTSQPVLKDRAKPAQKPEKGTEQSPSGQAAYPSKSVPRELSPSEILSDRIAEAEDRDVIADLLMRYVGEEFHRGALFLVRENMATGWKAVMMKMMLAGFDRFQITFDDPSILKIVAEGSSYYLGPVPEAPNNEKIIKALGGGKPPRVLLLPLIIMGRVVNILYVEGKGDELRTRVPELQKILSKAAMAFEILILKNKIKMF